MKNTKGRLLGRWIKATVQIKCPHGVIIPQDAEGKITQRLGDELVKIMFHGHDMPHTCNVRDIEFFKKVRHRGRDSA